MRSGFQDCAAEKPEDCVRSETSEHETHTNEYQNDSPQKVKESVSVGPTDEEGSVGECETVAGDNPKCARPDGQLCDLFFQSLVTFV